MAELCTPTDIKLGYYNFKCGKCGHEGCSRDLNWRPTLNPEFSPYSCPMCLSTNIMELKCLNT